MSGNKDIDQLSGVDTTGHEWDGIKELNNPLPRWWLWTLYLTIIFAIGYMVVYPAIPGLTTNTKGIWGWGSRADLRNQMTAVEQGRQAMNDKIAAMDINAIMADPEARTYAISAGASLFKVNCVQCHGSGAQGGPGYPNLNDDSWLWGGKPDQIVTTLTNGIRVADNPDTRTSQMPAFGKDGLLEPEKINQAANYVRKLANLEHDEGLATAGATVFSENCAACHGENGEGRRTNAGNRYQFPPLWGDASYNWGAGMANVDTAAAFIKHNMPWGLTDALGDQEAWDIAVYVNSRDRPQDPRFTGNVADTRAKFHESRWSLYGLAVDGRILGAPTP